MFLQKSARAALLAQITKRSLPNRKGILAVAARCNSNEPAEIDPVTHWKAVNDVYYGKDRDMVNFPPPKPADECPPTRHGFMPESYFKALYNKTGVTGPYVLPATVVAALITTEYWVWDHVIFSEFAIFFVGVYTYLIRFGVGPKTKQYLQTRNENYHKDNLYGPLEATKALGENFNKEMELALWREEGQKYLYEAKRENIALQLEEEYRKRLAATHEAVKKRLDYHLAIEGTKKTYEQENMVKWIVENVRKSITPQQEKDSLAKCISDLKVLAKAM